MWVEKALTLIYLSHCLKLKFAKLSSRGWTQIQRHCLVLVANTKN